MTRVARSLSSPAPPARAEALWYETDRWPAFVDGLASVEAVEGPWPEVGARVRWRSTPAGRGHVIERVDTFTPRSGQVTLFEDDRMEGRQEVTFVAARGGVRVTLSMDYRVKGAGPLGAIVDRLFIRRAVSDSLERTLAAFVGELADSR